MISAMADVRDGRKTCIVSIVREKTGQIKATRRNVAAHVPPHLRIR
jgi:hypothetical protein